MANQKTSNPLCIAFAVGCESIVSYRPDKLMVPHLDVCGLKSDVEELIQRQFKAVCQAVSLHKGPKRSRSRIDEEIKKSS